MGGQQFLQCAASDLRGNVRRVGGERGDQRIRHGTVGAAAIILPADTETGPFQAGEHLLERGEPDRVGVGHALSLCLREGQALLHGEGEPPAGRERPGYLPQQRLLVGKGKHGLEQQHYVEGAGRDRRDPRDLEATGKVAGPLTRDVDGAGAEIHPEIDATQLPRDEPPGSGDAAAEVEHGDAGCDAGPFRQSKNLPGRHEALLLDELAGGVRRHARSLQCLDERSALVLLHGCSTPRS